MSKRERLDTPYPSTVQPKLALVTERDDEKSDYSSEDVRSPTPTWTSLRANWSGLETPMAQEEDRNPLRRQPRQILFANSSVNNQVAKYINMLCALGAHVEPMNAGYLSHHSRALMYCRNVVNASFISETNVQWPELFKCDYLGELSPREYWLIVVDVLYCRHYIGKHVYELMQTHVDDIGRMKELLSLFYKI